MNAKQWAQDAHKMHGYDDAKRIATRSSHEWHRTNGKATERNRHSKFFIQCLHWLNKIDKGVLIG